MAEQHATTVEHVEEAAHGHQLYDATFWVAAAVLCFIGLLVWKKVPGIIGGALDKRSKEIEDQLEEARSLREEASALLAQYERDQREAEKTAAELMEHAKAEVKLLTDEARAVSSEMIERREQLAKAKIAQAEVNAVKEIRSLAVTMATSAARELIQGNLKGADQEALIKDSIDKLDSRLH